MSQRFYRCYLLKHQVGGLLIPGIVPTNFMAYAREHCYSDGTARLRKKTDGKTVAMGVRFGFELLEN